MKQSDVFRNLIDVAKEESTDDTGCKADITALTFTKKISSFARTTTSKETEHSENESQSEITPKADRDSEPSMETVQQNSEPELSLIDQNTILRKRVIRDNRRVPTFQDPAQNFFKQQTDQFSLLFYSDSETGENGHEKGKEVSNFQHLIFSPNCTISKNEMLRYLTRVKKGLMYSVGSLKAPSSSYLSLKKSELYNFPKALPGICSANVHKFILNK